ncbi:RNA-directed DNA polymerase, eukaryota [Tanacetum coccineum]
MYYPFLKTSGQAIWVTLWGALGDTLVERKTNKVGLYPVVLTSMNVKLYSNKLYLSSGSSTQILDDPQIPTLHALLSENSEDEVSLSQAAVHADYSQAKERTLENLLIWARNRKNDSSTFKYRVKIDDIRSRKGWNFLGCGGEKCKKGVVRKNGSFWCQACEKAVDYPVLRFWLELDVSDKTASTIVVMFDEPAKELLKCSADSLAAADDESGFGYADHAGLPLALANIIGTTHTLEMKSHTYYEHGTFESFTCWRIAPEEVVNVDSKSSNMNTSAEVNITKVKRLATKPSVATPSKPTEERGEKDSDDEVTGDMDDGGADGKESSLTDKGRKRGTLWMIVTLRKPSELQATKAVGLISEINRQAVMD